MTVILRRNESLELNLAEFRGPIVLDELRALAKYQADKPHLLAADCLNLVCADADFSGITLPELDGLFETYRRLFTPLRLQIFRRAVWYCEAEAPKGHITYWLSLDAREGMATTVKQCHSFAESADWLLLMDTERGMLERREGFDIVEVFELPPLRAAAR